MESIICCAKCEITPTSNTSEPKFKGQNVVFLDDFWIMLLI